ncbi:MAG TPA: alpha/beta fold hydrolase [Streptosporangiaceae bacterium]|jgi:pimeloyl-ACP methyl ester carboxylesterase
MTPVTPRAVAVPGTMCTPRLYQPLAHRMGGAVRMTGYDWMTRPGPWDIPSVAARLLTEITARTRPDDGPLVLIGHSTGGAIAVQAAILAARRGVPVAGLLIMNSGADTAGHGDIDALIDVFRTDRRRGWRTVGGRRSFARRRPGRHRVLGRLAPLLPMPGPVTRLRMEAYARRVPTDAVVEVLASQRDLDLGPDLPAVACPVTVLHGLLDTARTPGHARAIAEGVRDGEVRWVRTGHTPMVEAPGAAADALHSLLARI